ncbi:MAG: hypothetical protein FWD60_13995 [Candidatus Azobacteroides sp.]|nr:hypothetical protein [Candidatus Azobacteroides sp.]
MKRILKLTIILSLFPALISCHRYPQGVREALKLAGANRPELEAVLNHYSRNDADSLKYKAACFLIANMPGHYSLAGENADSLRNIVKKIGIHNDYLVTNQFIRMVGIQYFEDKYAIPPLSNLEKVYDINVITAGYLIENIELAFATWENSPWRQSITFADFCEHILPYRTGNEPLENWRRKYNETFHPVLDSLLKSDNIDEAGKLLYDTIYNLRWIFDNRLSSETIGALELLNYRVGDCRLSADYATFAFRSVGIPCGIDCILQNPDMLYQQHYWNYIINPSGKPVFFELYQSAPSSESEKIKRKKGKVYRIYYNKQESSIASLYKNEKLPSQLNNACLTDVSSEYFGGATVEFNIPEKQRNKKFLYLGVFNNKMWIPITVSPIKQGKTVFRNLEPGIVYQALYYQDEQLIPFSVPFITEENGKAHFLNPDKVHLQTIQIDRKYPLPVWLDEFKHRSVGGLFQGANKGNFSDAVTLFTTKKELNMYYQWVKIKNPDKFKYLRYYSAPDSHCNMAEIQFFCKGKELTGKVIGTDGSSQYTKEASKYAVFDKDPVTFFDSFFPDSAWVGLELDKPSAVTEIEYLYRCDDNGIREGDIYELYYFSENGLVSLGKRAGIKNGTLFYDNVPANALYLLHDRTRGQEERIFTYENGKQIWW